MTQPPIPFEPKPHRLIAIVNARVWTGDPRRPWADAVLLRDDRIDTVGSSAEVKKRSGTGVTILDARGMLVMPAIPDERLVRDGDEIGVAPIRLSDALATGVLRAGLPADLTVIDRDISRMEAAAISEARIVLRLAAGRIVHDPRGLLGQH